MKSLNAKIENEVKSKKKYKKIYKKKWTVREEKKLSDLVKELGPDWKIISNKIKSRSAHQCMLKYNNMTKFYKKGKWTKNEDDMIKKWVNSNGPDNWTYCSGYIEGRSGRQCRERWINFLNPKLKKGTWTKEEQTFLFQQILKNYFSWVSISKKFKNRSENYIKNFFYSSMRRLKQNIFSNVIQTVYQGNNNIR